MQAIEVLLSHGVKEEKILFLNLVGSKMIFFVILTEELRSFVSCRSPLLKD